MRQAPQTDNEEPMTENIRIDAEALQTFVRDLFVAAGLDPEWAAAEAEVLVWADLRGVGSHGVLRVPSYLMWMSRNLRRPDADIRIIAEKGAMALLEADRGPGLYVMRKAMDMAIERARDHAIGWVVIRQTTHTGPMGFFVRQAAKAGMIGIASCSSRPLMAYHGTRDAALGTAPLAISAPRMNGEPLVLDMASAAISIGALAQARQNGLTLPDDVAIDADGHATTDPHAAVTPLPVGGPKGAGLGLMIECITSLLAGLPLLASAFENPAERTDYVQNALVAAIDPAMFPAAEDFPAEVDRLARRLAEQPRADGCDEILMPGERGDREAARRRSDGIELSAALWRQLCDQGQRYGTPAPAT